MKPCASIAWNEMKRVEEWHIIATVHVDCFHQPDCDPRPHQYEMSRGQDDAEEESEPKYCKVQTDITVLSFQLCLFCIADYIISHRTLMSFSVGYISFVFPYCCSITQKVVDGLIL